MKRPYIRIALAIALISGHWSLQAEDIDLFVGKPGAIDAPNILFVIDNTANWNQAFTNEMAALVNTFEALKPEADEPPRFNIGIMFSAESGGNNKGEGKGGYVRAAIRTMDSANIDAYKIMFTSLDRLRDAGNAGASSLMMAEAFRYLTGGDAYAGTKKEKTDFAGNTGSLWSPSVTAQASLDAMKVIYGLGKNALDGYSGTKYIKPDQGSGCAKNFIIYISNGPSQDNNSVISKANSMLVEAGGSTAQIPVSPTNSQENVSDEWARFMEDEHGIITYVIDVNPGTQLAGRAWTALLKSMANVQEIPETEPNSRYAAVNSATDAGKEISEKLGEILAEILATNSVFASVSLPVSVNTQGTYLNQVFVGMFRPDAEALPRWHGNLKQYKMGISGTSLQLQDADGLAAIDPNTGFIDKCAKSFWTTTSDYWDFSERTDCKDTNETANKISDSPDGNLVEKGGHAQKLRNVNPSNRVLTTCSTTFADCDTDLITFHTDNEANIKTLLGVPDDQVKDLINWARGADIKNEKGDGPSVMRPSVHGDVLHSRPLALNFSTSGPAQVVVFYGGNDGVFRAINGNRDMTDANKIGGVPAGGELWGFIPPEFVSHFKRLRDNSPRISFPNVIDADKEPKPYGFDGPVSGFIKGDTAWVYATMRRGGRLLYAFTAKMTSSGLTMDLAWKQGCSGGMASTECTDINDIGQTWSAPKVVETSKYTAGPLLMMGGGYDTCEDKNEPDCSSSKGRSIYVLDATTGDVVTSFSTERGVVADIVVVPDAVTGQPLHAYAVDLGGNIYRIDMKDMAPTEWTKTHIASLGCETTATCKPNRKFMFAPDVVRESDGSYVLLLGSGDREKPLDTSTSVSDHFFMIKDSSATGWFTSETGNCDGNAIICMKSLLGITSNETPDATDLNAKKGWYLGLDPTEQVVTTAITVFGRVSFSTHTPPDPQPGQCSSSLGTARVYNIFYTNAASQNGTNNRYEDLPKDIGLPPSPVAGMVTLDNGDTVPFCIGCTNESPLEAEEPPIPPSAKPGQPKRRVYWYIQK